MLAPTGNSHFLTVQHSLIITRLIDTHPKKSERERRTAIYTVQKTSIKPTNLRTLILHNNKNQRKKIGNSTIQT